MTPSDHPWRADNVKHLRFLGDDYTDCLNLLEFVPTVPIELLLPHVMEEAGSNPIGLLFWMFRRFLLGFAYNILPLLLIWDTTKNQ